jgi:hypothetical protein
MRMAYMDASATSSDLESEKRARTYMRRRDGAF